MTNILLFVLPIIFTTSAQLLLKLASSYAIKSTQWILLIGGSIFAYFISFAVYSFAVRVFPISLISPVTTIVTMLLVATTGIVLGEVLTARQLVGVGIGIIAIILIILK